MYRLKNKLFGWDYIYWVNSADSGIARVFKTKDDRIVYWRYRITSVMDEITHPAQVVWMTCDPSKYFTSNPVTP